MATGMRAFTSHQRRQIKAYLIRKYGPVCQICFGEKYGPIDMTTQREDDSFSFDHIIALADGGKNIPENMQPAHIACNELKGSNKVAGWVRTNRKPSGVRKPVIAPRTASKSRLAYSSASSNF